MNPTTVVNSVTNELTIRNQLVGTPSRPLTMLVILHTRVSARKEKVENVCAVLEKE